MPKLFFEILSLLEFLILIGVLVWGRKDLKKKNHFYMMDTITGGYNRKGFLSIGSKYCENNEKNYSVVCFNICEFRRINELWGEDTGNQVLCFVYKKLAAGLSEKELICRSSMDRFVVLLNESSEEIIYRRSIGMMKSINDEIHKNFQGYNLDFFVGGCRLADEKNLAQAISKGFYAIKEKKEKNECFIYDEEFAKKREEEYEISEMFEEALSNHDFQIYLQPKIAKDGRCKAEALLRWVDSEKGMIYPNQFIPVFEKNGTISRLDLYVFEEVCKLLSNWIKEEKDIIEISVNLSRFTLKDNKGEMLENYRSIKEKYAIPDNMIEIELTETALLDGNQIAYIKQIVDGFRLSGMKVALDDFGFAYSSLAVLKELNVDTIKLDRSFFVDETPKSKSIVKNIIQLVHNLNICVVAEGIENMEQANVLWENGSDYIQGYVYSKPLPIDMFEKWRNTYEKQKF